MKPDEKALKEKQYIDKLRLEYIDNHRRFQERDELIAENNIEKRDIKGYHGREILELLQNADDAYQKSIDKKENPKCELKVTICYKGNVLTVTNTGTCFDEEGIKAIVQGNNSPKSGKYIGNKGTGFRSILNWAEKIRIFSGNYNIEFSKEIAEKILEENRDKPYIVQKTIKWVIDSDTGKLRQEKATIGYARTRAEGLKMLAEYNADPYDVEKSKKTFAQIYESWSTQKYDTISESNAKAYSASFSCCSAIHDRIFKELRVNDLQGVVDTCGKNYPTLRKLKVLFRQMYSYAMRLDICGKDYSEFVDIARYKDKNPNARARDRISEEDIKKLWTASENEEAQIALMLIYTGVRVSELLDLKKSNINLDEQWFDVVKSKTENGIRKVPIADKLMPFFRSWCKRDCEYLICTHDNEHFTYRNYYDSYWKPVIAQLGIDSKTTPHFTRHTCVSMLADAGITPTIIKKIVGHSGAMSVTESVYTHLDIKVLVDAVNKITP